MSEDPGQGEGIDVTFLDLLVYCSLNGCSGYMNERLVGT